MIGIMSARCLSIHAEYACRHAAACCAEAWSVAAEPRVVELVRRGVVRPIRQGPAFVTTPQPELAGSTSVLAHAGGWCVFFERDPGRLCSIHRRAGEQALPAACRHFPRLYLHDARGSSISLSHFCPTAASLLLEPVSLKVVDAAPPLALAGETEGFEARDGLPPLLRPEMLMDHAAYDGWEQRGIDTFARDDLTPDQALDLIAAATETVRRWTPADVVSLRDRVGEAFSSTAPPHEAQAGPFDRATKNYLAARLFANRIAYQGRGLRTIVEWLRICLSTLRTEMGKRQTFIEAIRSTDLTLIHRTDSLALARSLQGVEARERRRGGACSAQPGRPRSAATE